MTIELAPELQQRLDAQIKSGRFKSASAVVNEAVERFLIQEEDAKLGELRALIDEGLADLDAGRFVEDFDVNKFLAERHREFAAKSRS